MPDPLRDADYQDIQKMSDQEFRTRLLYELSALHTNLQQSSWWQSFQGWLNSALLSILVAIATAIFIGKVGW